MNKKKLIILISAIVALAILVCVGLFAISGNKGSKIVDKLDMGEKYLEELEYEKALAVYNEVLVIDPKNVDAYLGIVDTYIAMGNYKKALEYAEEGFEETEDEELQEKIKELEVLFGEAQPIPLPTEAPTPEPTAVPEPEIQKIQVQVDLKALAEACVAFFYEDISMYENGYVEFINFKDKFGLFDITGDGIPELIAGHASSIATYWQGEVWLIFESWTVSECYYDEETHMTWNYCSGQGNEEITALLIDTTEGEYPYEWLSIGERITENIDLTQYTHIDGNAYDKVANMDVLVMEETLRNWFASQEHIELTEPVATEETYPDDYVIDWKDEQLEMRIRLLTNIFDRDVMYSDVMNITELDLSNKGIYDISALGDLTNLEKLILRGNQITDISALSNLSNLTELDLASNRITDISALSDLTNLSILSLWGNDFVDTNPLSVLPSLVELDLSNNEISDISMLGKLTNLEKLYLQWNNISDISALSDLTNLKVLNLENNQITDISALSNMTKITELNLSINDISDISPLSRLVNLAYLNLSDNYQIDNIDALYDMTNMITLDLSDNQIADVDALSRMVNLTRLDMNDNRISDIEALSKITSMKELFLEGNEISDIGPVKDMVALEVLWLSDNEVSDISVLSGLTKLNSVRLYANSILDYSPVNFVTDLAY